MFVCFFFFSSPKPYTLVTWSLSVTLTYTLLWQILQEILISVMVTIATRVKSWKSCINSYINDAGCLGWYLQRNFERKYLIKYAALFYCSSIIFGENLAQFSIWVTVCRTNMGTYIDLCTLSRSCSLAWLWCCVF